MSVSFEEQSGFQSFLGFQKFFKNSESLLKVFTTWPRSCQSQKFETVVNRNRSIFKNAKKRDFVKNFVILQ